MEKPGPGAYSERKDGNNSMARGEIGRPVEGKSFPERAQQYENPAERIDKRLAAHLKNIERQRVAVHEAKRSALDLDQKAERAERRVVLEFADIDIMQSVHDSVGKKVQGTPAEELIGAFTARQEAHRAWGRFHLAQASIYRAQAAYHTSAAEKLALTVENDPGSAYKIAGHQAQKATLSYLARIEEYHYNVMQEHSAILDARKIGVQAGIDLLQSEMSSKGNMDSSLKSLVDQITDPRDLNGHELSHLLAQLAANITDPSQKSVYTERSQWFESRDVLLFQQRRRIETQQDQAGQDVRIARAAIHEVWATVAERTGDHVTSLKERAQGARVSGNIHEFLLVSQQLYQHTEVAMRETSRLAPGDEARGKVSAEIVHLQYQSTYRTLVDSNQKNAVATEAIYMMVNTFALWGVDARLARLQKIEPDSVKRSLEWTVDELRRLLPKPSKQNPQERQASAISRLEQSILTGEFYKQGGIEDTLREIFQVPGGNVVNDETRPRLEALITHLREERMAAQAEGIEALKRLFVLQSRVDEARAEVYDVMAQNATAIAERMSFQAWAVEYRARAADNKDAFVQSERRGIQIALETLNVTGDQKDEIHHRRTYMNRQAELTWLAIGIVRTEPPEEPVKWLQYPSFPAIYEGVRQVGDW